MAYLHNNINRTVNHVRLVIPVDLADLQFKNDRVLYTHTPIYIQPTSNRQTPTHARAFMPD